VFFIVENVLDTKKKKGIRGIPRYLASLKPPLFKRIADSFSKWIVWSPFIHYCWPLLCICVQVLTSTSPCPLFWETMRYLFVDIWCLFWKDLTFDSGHLKSWHKGKVLKEASISLCEWSHAHQCLKRQFPSCCLKTHTDARDWLMGHGLMVMILG